MELLNRRGWVQKIKGDIQINSHVFHPNGYRKLTEGFIEFEKTQRSINNTLTSDFLAKKRTFVITWENCSIDGELLDEFIAISNSSEDVTFTKTNYDLTETSVTCRLKLSNSFARVYDDGKYAYNGVEVTLEEI